MTDLTPQEFVAMRGGEMIEVHDFKRLPPGMRAVEGFTYRDLGIVINVGRFWDEESPDWGSWMWGLPENPGPSLVDPTLRGLLIIIENYIQTQMAREPDA